MGCGKEVWNLLVICQGSITKGLTFAYLNGLLGTKMKREWVYFNALQKDNKYICILKCEMPKLIVPLGFSRVGCK
jgi:hypothetical protein